MGTSAGPAVSLKRAREKAADTARQQARGATSSPIVVVTTVTRLSGRHSKRSSPARTLSNVKHRAQWRSTIVSYALPIIGNRPVADVQPEILAMMRPLRRSKPETAGRLLQRIDEVMHFAIANNWRERASASIGAWRVLGSRRNGEDRHHRFLPYEEIPSLIARLRSGIYKHQPTSRWSGPCAFS